MAITDNGIVREDMEYLFRKAKDPGVFQGKSIVITGGAGFVGYYLTLFFAYLKERGQPCRSVLVLDSFRGGVPDWLRELAGLHPEVEYRSFDVAKDSLEGVPEAADADYAIHMASIASPSFYRSYPVETMEANVLGLWRLLEFYKERSLEGLLFLSSSEVYGDPPGDRIPTPETYLGNVATMGPRACYDESKRAGETLCWVYNRTYGIPARIVRPFNNYGPGMSPADGRVPADFARAALGREPLVLRSDGTPTRTFCYIADAIDGYLRALTHGEFGCFNIGMDRPELSIREFAGLYRDAAYRLWGEKPDIRFAKSPDEEYLTDNPARRCPDLTKARAELGYRPEIGPVQGIERYLRFLEPERLPV